MCGNIRTDLKDEELNNVTGGSDLYTDALYNANDKFEYNELIGGNKKIITIINFDQVINGVVRYKCKIELIDQYNRTISTTTGVILENLLVDSYFKVNYH